MHASRRTNFKKVCIARAAVNESVYVIISLVPGARKIGGSTWYTLFAHAQSLHGNLCTTSYTKYSLTKQSISVYLLISDTAELCSP